MNQGLKNACLLLGLLAGCRVAPESPAGYFGPTESLSAVSARINQNAKAIPTLFARHYLEATIKDPQTGKSHFINASGDLFLRKPRELYLRAKKDPVPVFELGSTADRYWLTVFVDPSTHWWGHHKNADEECVKNRMPIRPDLIGEVLGVNPVGESLLELPAPTLRFNNDLDVYMMTWHDEVGDHWIARKEIWYDRATLRPRKVLLFDLDGRVIVRANLSKHAQVVVKDLAEDKRPWIATDFDLFFPDSQSSMKIQLSDVALTTSNGNPKEGTIRFPEEPDVPAANQIQIDRNCN